MASVIRKGHIDRTEAVSVDFRDKLSALTFRYLDNCTAKMHDIGVAQVQANPTDDAHEQHRAQYPVALVVGPPANDTEASLQ